MNFDLARTQRVMSQLGNPQNYFPSVHIAGTNGKGSVTAMISSVLREAGVKVGMYTSPHLEKINERFQINGAMISTPELTRLSRSLQKRFSHLTQFEFLTVLAFVWFAEKEVDVAVVETGLGGRLDATNVLSHVLVSVITNIDLDHTDWLGNTLEKIAFEKAGIIKNGVPLVTGATGKAFEVIKSKAKEANSPVVQVLGSSPSESLLGRHQQRNTELAKVAIRTLSENFFHITENQVKKGLGRVRWPGRFERIMVGSASHRQLVILDGAHNPAGCRALVETLREQRLDSVNLLFGALKDKNVAEMARILSPVVELGVTVTVPSERSADPSKLSALKVWQGKMVAVKDVGEGLKALLSMKGNRPILVAGSLYLVGDIRRRIR